MQTTTDLYKSILADPHHLKEHRAFIADVEYSGSDIITDVEAPSVMLDQPPVVTGGLYSSGVPAIGCCVARQLDIMVRPKGDIPRMAEIRMETRLVLRDPLTGENTQESEWLPKGTFYIDTRQALAGINILRIHGYDAMLKAEQTFLTETTEDDWPKPMDEVVAEIAKRMGVTIDARTVINPDYMVDYPNDYTMREILGYIAAAHAGNWIITDAGELYLVPLYNPATDRANYGYLVTEDGNPIAFGEVCILV